MDTTGSAPRETWTDHVQIREVGVPAGPAGDAAGYPGPPESDDAAAGRSRPFLPAWLVTGALLAMGVLWLSGAFESVAFSGYTYNSSTGSPIPQDNPPWTVPLRNMAQVAPMMLLLGTMSASALLIVQGSQRAGKPHPVSDH